MGNKRSIIKFVNNNRRVYGGKWIFKLIEIIGSILVWIVFLFNVWVGVVGFVYLFLDSFDY